MVHVYERESLIKNQKDLLLTHLISENKHVYLNFVYEGKTKTHVHEIAGKITEIIEMT